MSETRPAVVRCLAQVIEPWDSARYPLGRLCKAVLDGRLGADVLDSGDEDQIELAAGPLRDGYFDPDDPQDAPSDSEAEQFELDNHAAVLALTGLAHGRLGEHDAVEGVWWIGDDTLAEHGVTYDDIREAASHQGYPVAAAVILEALELSA